MSTHNKIHSHITDQILTALSDPSKLSPWRRPWTALDANIGHPCNALTGRPYRGINTVALSLSAQQRGYQSRHWLTFRQAKEMGVSVRSGEKGTHVVLFKPIRAIHTTHDGEEQRNTFCLMRTFCVFNVEQTTGLDHLRVGNAPIDPQEVGRRYEHADEVIKATGFTIRHGGDRAFYSITEDYIQMPHRRQFERIECYYETLFHEAIHMTEHPTRLNWERARPENSYAMGELIAELGCCFLAGELGLPTGEGLQNHASYLNHWVQMMQADNRAIFKAAARASQAVRYILSYTRTQNETPADDNVLICSG